jgi:malonyl-CoA O-methyltransferase
MLPFERLSRLWRPRPTLVDPRRGYAQWAPLYPAHAHNPVMAAESSRMRPMIHAASPRRALDVGTGTGRNLEMLAAAGARFVTGVDMSDAMLACGVRTHPRVRGNALQLPFRAGAFDLVCSSLMCGDIQNLGGWIEEASRVVCDGGHVIYSDFHPQWAAAGWKRTFHGADGGTYELPLCAHAVEEHLEQLERHRLDVLAVHEPCVPGGSKPVVTVFYAVKRGARRP